ncbi:MAG: hypothetical protein P4M15_11185 [Alphaproteobacteria bacterium]|nr:hypothetical protein [Alphaproteobacteria bacterium]
MKPVPALALIVSLLAAGVVSSPAGAVTVNFNGTNYDMGTVVVGQTGVINTSPISLNFLDPSISGNGLGLGYGFLPPDSKITFTYTLLSPGAHFGETQLISYGIYDYSQAGAHYRGEAGDIEPAHNNLGGVAWSYGTVNGSSSAPLTLATADILGAKQGTTTIVNNSASDVYFLSALDFGDDFGRVFVTYVVSAIPLPATLPLFLLGLTAMAVMAYRRKAQGSRVG